MRVRIRVDVNNPRAEEKNASRFSNRKIASDDLVLDLSHVWEESSQLFLLPPSGGDFPTVPPARAGPVWGPQGLRHLKPFMYSSDGGIRELYPAMPRTDFESGEG